MLTDSTQTAGGGGWAGFMFCVPTVHVVVRDIMRGSKPLLLESLPVGVGL
jgi:hypothetical protein